MNTEIRRKTDGIVLRCPRISDGKQFWEIAKASKTLDVNSLYHYLMMCRHFGGTSIAAENDGRVVGFVTAYIPPKQGDTVFVWQVAVDAEARGRGLGVQMLLEVFEQAKAFQVQYLDATITPSNKASVNLFTSVARKLNASFEFEKEFFSSTDFGRHAHEAEMLFHIGPVID